MQHLHVNEVERRAARATACPHCYQRPPGSEALGPETARSCEARCPLFIHLPLLVQIAGRVQHGGDAAAGECEHDVQLTVCRHCDLSPTAGEFCVEYATRTCPLSRHAGDVISALSQLHVPRLQHA